MDWEKVVDEELKKNPELKQLFADHPEKKDEYIAKLRDSDASDGGYYTKPNPVYCRTCVFSHGSPPFEDAPEKFFCAIYRSGGREGKPPEVLFDGAECEYYEKEETQPTSRFG